MTQQQMVELVRAAFPEIMEKTIRVMLNEANHQFVEETRIIRNTATITTIADTTDYALSLFAVGGNNPIYIERVLLGGRDIYRLPVHDTEAWTADEKTLSVGHYTIEDNQVTLTAVKAGTSLQLYAVYEDAGFSADLAETPNYPPAFHQAPYRKVMEQLYAGKGDLQQAQYFRAEYADVRRRAKMYINSQGVRGAYQSEQENFRGL